MVVNGRCGTVSTATIRQSQRRYYHQIIGFVEVGSLGETSEEVRRGERSKAQEGSEVSRVRVPVLIKANRRFGLKTTLPSPFQGCPCEIQFSSEKVYNCKYFGLTVREVTHTKSPVASSPSIVHSRE